MEGTSKHGKVTAWVAPDKNYAAIKWIVEKTGSNFINDKPLTETELIFKNFQYDCNEFQLMGSNFIPAKVTFVSESKYKNGNSDSVHIIYSISDVQLNPDFNALGAFKIDLPEGTRITIPESPGIKYVWKDGKAVPDVDGQTFEEIDKAIDQMKQQQ